MKFLLICLAALWAAPGAHAESLTGPAMTAALERESAAAGASLVVLDLASGEVIFSNWDDLQRPIPFGSLVKPFTALAYGASHRFRYPEFSCSGRAGECWLPGGHGQVDIRSALAHSCNAYFRHLSEGLEAAQLTAVTLRFAMASPAPEASSETYWGLGGRWKITPLQITRAYAELARRSAEPGVRPLLEGLSLCARSGTAGGIGRALPRASGLAKTGTAPCVHRDLRGPSATRSDPRHAALTPSNGDGYVLALTPRDRPRYALLLQVHGVPGRQAAVLGGKLLALLAPADPRGGP